MRPFMFHWGLAELAQVIRQNKMSDETYHALLAHVKVCERCLAQLEKRIKK